MNEQNYYRQLVSDAEVISALLREGQARETGVVVEKPRARPNLNFIQRTITNMVSSNQRKISEQHKRIETAKKMNMHYMVKRPLENYKHTKEKWTDEEILAHKKAMLACRIRFIRAVEGISAPEKAGVFDKPSLYKLNNKQNCDRKKVEGKGNLKTSSSQSSLSSVMCDIQSNVEKDYMCSSKKLDEKMRKSRLSARSSSNSSSCSGDLNMERKKDTQRSKKDNCREIERCSRSSTSSSSSRSSDRIHSRSISSFYSSLNKIGDKSPTFKRKRKKCKKYSSPSSDSSCNNKTSKGIKTDSSSTSSSVICISESDTESHTTSKCSENHKRLSDRDLKIKKKMAVDREQKKCCRKKRRKRHRTSSSSTKGDLVSITDTKIVSIVITDSDSECDTSHIPEGRNKI